MPLQFNSDPSVATEEKEEAREIKIVLSLFTFLTLEQGLSEQLWNVF
jgi:hypothetical protein